jgi:hypothetical protein
VRRQYGLIAIGVALAVDGKAIQRHEGKPSSSQIGRHHQLALARLDLAMTVQNLNCSIAAWYILDQASVISAIPGIALGLKRPTDSVAIFEYCVAHEFSFTAALNGKRPGILPGLHLNYFCCWLLVWA